MRKLWRKMKNKVSGKVLSAYYYFGDVAVPAFERYMTLFLIVFFIVFIIIYFGLKEVGIAVVAVIFGVLTIRFFYRRQRYLSLRRRTKNVSEVVVLSKMQPLKIRRKDVMRAPGLSKGRWTALSPKPPSIWRQIWEWPTNDGRLFWAFLFLVLLTLVF